MRFLALFTHKPTLVTFEVYLKKNIKNSRMVYIMEKYWKIE